MPRLIVVSNRLPFTLVSGPEGGFEFHPSSGGLVTALGSYLDARRGSDPDFECIWVGWPGGSVPDEAKADVKEKALKRHGAYPVFLDEQDIDLFYHGFCNGTLWPLFHYFPSFVEYDPDSWEAYIRVNAQFRDAVLEILQPGDRLWVHDYQLLLLPKMLRDAAPDARIGLFLHIPFPSFEMFRLLPTPWRQELLEGMLGADLNGFHTHDYAQYFLRCVFRTLGHEPHLGQVSWGDQVRRADTFPIGIVYEKFHEAAKSLEVDAERKRFERSLLGRKAIFSVDRLDYTKGILNRLRGYEEFLKRYPEWRGKVVFVLTVVPSREAVDQYARMKQELDELVGHVNGEYGSVDWAPIAYQYRHLDFNALVALYSLAPVALITPLRDGMNLVAKEYVACKPDGQGVLILSDMAGAARELGEALIVNPNYRGEIADALDEALKMPPSEQEKRMRPMQERLQAYDAKRWATNFLDTLERVRDRQALLATKPLGENARAELTAAYQGAKRPLVLLDYDGTLVPFAPQPHMAAPDEDLLRIMRRLAGESRNEVYIISGRDKGTLGAWFAGMPVGLIAEHGAWIREPGQDWRMLKPLASEWKEHLRPILQRYVDQVSGSLLEEKDYSIAWHYRRCDPELGLQRSKELIDDIIGFTANFDVQVLEGKKVVEIRNAGVNKGAAGLHCVDALGPDFILAMGDDQTDEDMFRALPGSATSIRVGNRFSHAKYNLESHREVRRFLAGLVGITAEA